MSRRRKRIFGPIMYAALLAWGLVAIYSGVEFATPRVENWLKQRRILKALGVRISRRARALCWTWNTRAPRSQGLAWSRHSVTRALMYDLRRATRWRTTGMSRSP